MTSLPNTDVAHSTQAPDEVARSLVAEALNLPIERVTEDLSIHNCDVWDSLGQMQIASALHDRFGVQLQAEQIFQISDMQRVNQLIKEKPSQPSIDEQSVDLPENPEWLPLLDYQKATQALATRYQGKRDLNSQPDTVSVVIAASYTAQPIATSLQLWTRAFGFGVNVAFHGYNQVHQALLDEQSPFTTNKTGVNVVLVRLEDLQGDSYEGVLEQFEQLLASMDQFTGRTGGRLIVSTLPQPASSYKHKGQEWVGLARAIWQKRLTEKSAVDILDSAAVVENIGLSSALAIENDIRARMPYSARVFQDMGIELARVIRRQRRPPAKVLALDCDGVLWGGAVAEVGLSGIQLSDDGEGRGYKRFQECILQLQKRGVLLVLSSRNDESSVWEVFEQHPDMVLKKEHISASRINWRPKSQNLQDLASDLNLVPQIHLSLLMMIPSCSLR